MWKPWSLVALACIMLVLVSGSAQPASEPVVVDEPSVRLEAELNLHYKTFSEVTLSDEYMEQWLYKYNYLPGAEVMGDEELFSAIDLDYTGLESVKTAVNAGDYGGAGEALAHYFMERESPCHVDPGKLSPSSRDKVLEVADECLQNPGFPDIPWSREKFGRGTKDACWNWVSYLFLAYRYTGDEKYMDGAFRMFSFWYGTVRPPAGTPRIWLSPSFINNPWDSHQTASRLSTLAMIDSLIISEHGGEIPDDLQMPLYKSIVEHARFLISVNPGYRSGNIQIRQMLCLLEAGIHFPEFKESQEWIDYGWDGLLKHAWLDLLPDGGHYERAASYNNCVVKDFRHAIKLARTAGLDVPNWLEPKLKNAQAWTTKVYSPLLNLTPVGDSSMGPEGYALPYLIDGALLFPCPEFKFFVIDHRGEVETRALELFGEGAQEVMAQYDAIVPQAPPYTSVLLPDTGWAVMRSSWNREARYMLFDYGSNEPWHCHRDGLGFSIFAYGEPLITDCGHGGGYESDRSKEWYKETISHNLVLINGMSQRKVTDGACDRWVTSPTADYIDAMHDGYKYLGAYCRRKITFVKPDYWIITDNLTEKMCQTSGYHECEWLAHFQPTELIIDDESKAVHTNNPGANALLVPSRPGSLTVNESRGWAATPTGEVDDAPYIGYTREGDLPVDYEVVIYPYQGASVPDVEVERLDMGADAWRCKGLKITTPTGTDYYLESLDGDYYYILNEQTKFRSYGEFSFDGEMALIREADGKLQSIFLVGGTCLKRGGIALVDCPSGIDWAAVDYTGDTIVVSGEYSDTPVLAADGDAR